MWSQLLFAPLLWTAPTTPALAAVQPRPRSPTVITDAERLSTLADADAPVTDHALLVLLGHFAQHLGLLPLLHHVPLTQKKVRHTPQAKLITFLLAILAGLEHLNDLNDALAPLSADPTLAQAWGLPAFAHYSGVSRTLAAADEQTLDAVLEALASLSRPFIERELLALLRDGKPVLVDIDLTGRPVSSRATTYPDPSFGWMDDAVTNGYQSAISSLSGGPSGRLLLASQRYSGKATSAECLHTAVWALESRLGLRPRRRIEVVCAHLEQLAATRNAQEHAQQQTLVELHRAQQRHSRLAAQRSVTAERLVRAEQRIGRLAARVRRLERELWQLEQQQRERQEWLSQLERENQTLTSEVPVVLRLDAGS
jgi:hypothetical protein